MLHALIDVQVAAATAFLHQALKAFGGLNRYVDILGSQSDKGRWCLIIDVLNRRNVFPVGLY